MVSWTVILFFNVIYTKNNDVIVSIRMSSIHDEGWYGNVIQFFRIDLLTFHSDQEFYYAVSSKPLTIYRDNKEDFELDFESLDSPNNSLIDGKEEHLWEIVIIT